MSVKHSLTKEVRKTAMRGLLASDPYPNEGSRSLRNTHPAMAVHHLIILCSYQLKDAPYTGVQYQVEAVRLIPVRFSQ